MPPNNVKTKINGLSVTYSATADLRPHANNPKIHGPKEVALIARSIES